MGDSRCSTATDFEMMIGFGLFGTLGQGVHRNSNNNNGQTTHDEDDDSGLEQRELGAGLRTAVLMGGGPCQVGHCWAWTSGKLTLSVAKRHARDLHVVADDVAAADVPCCYAAFSGSESPINKLIGNCYTRTGQTIRVIFSSVIVFCYHSRTGIDADVIDDKKLIAAAVSSFARHVLFLCLPEKMSSLCVLLFDLLESTVVDSRIFPDFLRSGVDFNTLLFSPLESFFSSVFFLHFTDGMKLRDSGEKH